MSFSSYQRKQQLCQAYIQWIFLPKHPCLALSVSPLPADTPLAGKVPTQTPRDQGSLAEPSRLDWLIQLLVCDTGMFNTPGTALFLLCHTCWLKCLSSS